MFLSRYNAIFTSFYHAKMQQAVGDEETRQALDFLREGT